MRLNAGLKYTLGSHVALWAQVKLKAAGGQQMRDWAQQHELTKAYLSDPRVQYAT